MSRKPVAVLISDIHYSLSTLELADAAMRQAINNANALGVPVIVAGDLHDSKANLRGECVNRMLKTFSECKTKCFILVGNHDLINEKSEENSIEFLDYVGDTVDYVFSEKQVTIVRRPWFYNELGAINSRSIHLVPYHTNPGILLEYLSKVDPGSTLIMHQGLKGSNSGEYIQDKSAITHDDVKDFRVISGHYHTRQDIKTGRPQKGAAGLWSYIGNPYSLNFAEADDPEKGFQILMDDGTLEFVPTNLRKHAVLELEGYNLDLITGPALNDLNTDDIVKVKIIGTKDQLQKWTKNVVSDILGIANFKLELAVVDDARKTKPEVSASKPQLLDSLIEVGMLETETKGRLKQLWRDLCE